MVLQALKIIFLRRKIDIMHKNAWTLNRKVEIIHIYTVRRSYLYTLSIRFYTMSVKIWRPHPVGMMIREIPVRPRKKVKKATLRNLEIDQEKTCESWRKKCHYLRSSAASRSGSSLAGKRIPSVWTVAWQILLYSRSRSTQSPRSSCQGVEQLRIWGNLGPKSRVVTLISSK